MEFVQMDWSEIQQRWAHFSNLAFKTPKGPIDLLLGVDHPNLVAPMENQKGTGKESYAIETKLGWIARGAVAPDETQCTIRINFLANEETPLGLQFRMFGDPELALDSRIEE